MMIAQPNRNSRPSRPTMLFTIEAQQLLNVGRVRQAIEVCKRGLVYFPEHVTGYVLLARAYRDLGQRERAVNVLRDGYRRTGAMQLEQLRASFAGEVIAPRAEDQPAVGVPMGKVEELDQPLLDLEPPMVAEVPVNGDHPMPVPEAPTQNLVESEAPAAIVLEEEVTSPDEIVDSGAHAITESADSDQESTPEEAMPNVPAEPVAPEPSPRGPEIPPPAAPSPERPSREIPTPEHPSPGRPTPEVPIPTSPSPETPSPEIPIPNPNPSDLLAEPAPVREEPAVESVERVASAEEPVAIDAVTSGDAERLPMELETEAAEIFEEPAAATEHAVGEAPAVDVEPTVEEIPVEEIPVEEIPVEEIPVEEIPVEEIPVEEIPVEDAPAAAASEVEPSSEIGDTKNEPDDEIRETPAQPRPAATPVVHERPQAERQHPDRQHPERPHLAIISGAREGHRRGGHASTPGALIGSEATLERDRTLSLSIHSGGNNARLRSSNLRLIPGLEFAPLRHEEQMRKQPIAPLIHEPMPELTRASRKEGMAHATAAIPLPGDAAASRVASDEEPTTIAAAGPARNIVTMSTEKGPMSAQIASAASNVEMEGVDAVTVSAATADASPSAPVAADPAKSTVPTEAPARPAETRRRGMSIIDEIATRHPAPSGDARPREEQKRTEGLTPLEELARRLEKARIPVVEDSAPRATGGRSFEPQIVSETLADILLSQGAYQEALKAFRTLARTRADRAEYFQRKIREIEDRMAAEASGS